LLHDKDGSLADSRRRGTLSQNAEGPSDFRMGIEIRAHGEVHDADFLFLPCKMAVNRIYAYVQNLGIQRGELLAVRVERRHLLRSSRRPVQRMEAHHDVFFASKITKLYLQSQFVFNRGQLKVRGHIAYFQWHALRLPNGSLALWRTGRLNVTAVLG